MSASSAAGGSLQGEAPTPRHAHLSQPPTAGLEDGGVTTSLTESYWSVYDRVVSAVMRGRIPACPARTGSPCRTVVQVPARGRSHGALNWPAFGGAW